MTEPADELLSDIRELSLQQLELTKALLKVQEKASRNQRVALWFLVPVAVLLSPLMLFYLLGLLAS